MGQRGADAGRDCGRERRVRPARRRGRCARLTPALLSRRSSSETILSAALHAQSHAESGERETAAALDQAERRARVLHGISGAQGVDMLEAVEKLSQMDRGDREHEAEEAKAIQAVQAIQSGEQTTVERSGNHPRPVPRATP